MAKKSIREQLTNYQQGIRWLDKCIGPSWKYIFNILDCQWKAVGLDIPESCDAKLYTAIMVERNNKTQWAIEQTLKKSIPDLKENTVLFDDDEANPVVEALKSMQGRANEQANTAISNTAGTAT